MTRTTLSGLIALMLLTGSTFGQETCGERAKIVEQLKNQYGEVLVGRGLAANNTLLEVFASASGTWTALASNASGMSCLSSAGEGWKAYETDNSKSAWRLQ